MSDMYESKTWANAVTKVPVLEAERIIQKLTNYLAQEEIDINVDDVVELVEVVEFIKTQAIDLQIAKAESEKAGAAITAMQREITTREMMAQVRTYERITDLMFRNPTFQEVQVLRRNDRGEVFRAETQSILNPDRPDAGIGVGVRYTADQADVGPNKNPTQY